MFLRIENVIQSDKMQNAKFRMQNECIISALRTAFWGLRSETRLRVQSFGNDLK